MSGDTTSGDSLSRDTTNDSTTKAGTTNDAATDEGTADNGTATVSTHILDTGTGRPAEGVAVSLAARGGSGAPWTSLGGSKTDADGRCKDLPALPTGTTHVRLGFETEPYFDSGASFFPEVAITFTVTPGEHFHVPLLLSPFGYSVYRGS